MAGARAQVTALVQTLALLVLFLVPAEAAAADATPRVYLVVIDGLGAESLSPERTPFLWKLARGDERRATFYPRGHAVMPAVTNANHVSLATGTYARAHGITGNYYWERANAAGRQPTDRASLIEVETVFTALARRGHAAKSAAAFGKWKLVELFGTAGEQIGPGHLWGDRPAAGLLRALLPGAGGFPAIDARLMDEVMRVIEEADPQLFFASLPAVDLSSHAAGPRSADTLAAIRGADRQVERLVGFLEQRGLWSGAVLIVTADHGLAPVGGPDSLLSFGSVTAAAGLEGIDAVGNGALEGVYLSDPAPGAASLTPRQAEKLRAARALALSQPAIAEALYRLPNPLDGGTADTLDAVHPDWHLAHPRTGELVLVTRPGFFFNDPAEARIAAMKGNHGGPGEREVAILVTGGWPRLRDGVIEDRAADNAAVGATIGWLLGLPPPRYAAGGPVPASLCGRILREAFAE